MSKTNKTTKTTDKTNAKTIDRANLLKKASELFDADIVASLELLPTKEINDHIKNFESLPKNDEPKAKKVDEIKVPEQLNLLGGTLRVSKSDFDTHQITFKNGDKKFTVYVKPIKNVVIIDDMSDFDNALFVNKKEKSSNFSVEIILLSSSHMHIIFTSLFSIFGGTKQILHTILFMPIT
jgi:hypothetical protein